MRLRRVLVPVVIALGLPAAAASAAWAASVPTQVPQSAPKWTVSGGWGSATGSSGVTSVASASKTDAFAVGYSCGNPCAEHALAVRHWNGKKWSAVNPPTGLINATTGVLGAVVTTSSATDTWVFTLLSTSSGGHEDALHWNGKHWSTTKFPAFSNILTAATFGSKDAWAFGTQGDMAKPYTLRYNGTKWVAAHPPGLPEALSAPAASDLWALGPTIKTVDLTGSKQHYIALHWNGSKWSTLALPQVSKPAPDDYVVPGTVAALGPDNVWESYAFCNAGTCPPGAALEHWDGSKWHAVSIPYPVGSVTSMAADGHGGIWLTVRTDDTPPYAYYHLNNGHWSRQFPPAFINVTIVPAGLAWVPGTDELWSGYLGLVTGKGTQGVILGYRQ